MEVVEDENERSYTGPFLEPRADQPERLVSRGLGERLCKLVLGADVTEDLDERPVGDPFPVRQAAPREHLGVVAEAAEQLCDESRLADACRPEDGEEVTRGLGGGPLEGLVQQRQLTAAADHRCVLPPLESRYILPNGHESKSVDRLALALRGERFHLLDVDRVSRQPQCLLPDQDLSRRGRLLQPSSDVDCVARGQPLLGAGDDLAGVDADPHLHRYAVVALEVLVERRDRIAELRSGAQSPQGVVLVHGRNAEDGHDRVADELLDGPAVALQASTRRLEVAHHHAPE